MQVDLHHARPFSRLAIVTDGHFAFQVHQDSFARPDNDVMLEMVSSFMESLLAGYPDTLQFPSSWWDKSPKLAISWIYQILVNSEYLLVPVYEDSVYFIWLPPLWQHFAGRFQRKHLKAEPAAIASLNGPNNVCDTLPGDSSAVRLCTAAASPSQLNPQRFCKDCTTAQILSVRGTGLAMDTDTCTFQPADRAAQTLRATLSHRDEQGDTQVSLLLRLFQCGQKLCVTMSELAGSFQPSGSDTYVVQAVHISMQAASSGEAIPLVLYLQQSQEPHQLQARNIQVRQAAHRIAHDYTHRDVAADPKLRAEAGPGTGGVEAEGVHVSEKKHDLELVAQVDEDLVLSRLFPGSNALSQGTTIELKRYVDRCYKNNETQLSTLSFDGYSGDPVLFKGQLLGRADEKVTLQCSAVVNITAIRRTRCEKVFGVNSKKMSKLWGRETPQDVVARNRYISHDVKLCRAPAHISVDM